MYQGKEVRLKIDQERQVATKFDPAALVPNYVFHPTTIGTTQDLQGPLGCDMVKMRGLALTKVN